MRWFKWGRQSSFYGVPLGLLLLFIACIHFYSIAGTRELIRNMYWISSMNACTIKERGLTWMRMIFLTRILCSVLWSVHIVLAVALWKRIHWFLAGMLYWAPVIYAHDIAIAGYTLSAYLTPGSIYEEHLFFRNQYMQNSLIPWPTSFWVYFGLTVLLQTVLGIITVDAMISFIRIVGVDGSGWERKAFYEIHQATNETVETLQETWDKRIGITVPVKRKSDDDDDDEDDEERVAFRPAEERAPLVPGV